MNFLARVRSPKNHQFFNLFTRNCNNIHRSSIIFEFHWVNRTHNYPPPSRPKFWYPQLRHYLSLFSSSHQPKQKNHTKLIPFVQLIQRDVTSSSNTKPHQTINRIRKREPQRIANDHVLRLVFLLRLLYWHWQSYHEYVHSISIWTKYAIIKLSIYK